MKRIYFLLILLIPILCISQSVDIKTAQTVSKNYFRKTYQNGISVKGITKTISVDSVEIDSSYVKSFNGHDSYFVTNFKKGGWVITAAHKSVGPVLAHSSTGKIDIRTAPKVFIDWMSQYDTVIDSAFIKKKIKKDKIAKWETLESDSIINTSKLKSTTTPDGFYLIDTKWGQAESNDSHISKYSNGDYYSYPGDPAYIPAYNSQMNCSTCSCATTFGASDGNFTEKALAGCVAVAIGQIMKYWEFATGDYADFDWWDMPNELNYTNNSNFEKQSNAISYLLKRIGDRVSMDYGCTESGADTKDGIYVLKEFGYIENEMDYKRKYSYSYNQWVEILKNEINNNRPILYRFIGNHSFICDGYLNNSHTFHFNLGWNGAYTDAFFDFEDLKDDGVFDFSNTSAHACITGIQPNWQTVINIDNTMILTTTSDPWPNKKTYQAREINASGVWIGSQSDGRFLGYEHVKLLPGFWAMPGSTMLAKSFTNTQGTLKSFTEDYENSDAISYNQTIDEDIIDSTQQFTIYPNPSKNGKFTIKSNVDNLGIVSVEIINTLGQKVFYSTDNISSPKQIDLSSRSKGLYLIKIYNKNHHYCKNILIQ